MASAPEADVASALPAWAPPPPPPPRLASVHLLAVPAVLVAGAIAAVLLVHHGDGLVTPDSILGESRGSNGQFDGMISSLGDLLKRADPQISSVVVAVYGNGGEAGVPGHMLFAEKGVAQDPTQSLAMFTRGGFSLGAAGSVSLGSAVVTHSGTENLTCLTMGAQGLPQPVGMTFCLWSDAQPANAGGVMCFAAPDVQSCADYAGAARKAVLGG